MKKYAIVMTLQKIPIWIELLLSASPPNLNTLNKTLGMFGDELFVREIGGRIGMRLWHQHLQLQNSYSLNRYV